MSKSKRLGGGKITIEQMPTQTFVYKLDGMAMAVEQFRSGIRKRRKNVRECADSVAHQMMHGNAELPRVIEEAEELINAAILIDPRLARKSSWCRCEPDAGIEADAALIAQGEERSCFERRKQRMNECATTEPIRIVISTDCKEVDSSHAKAFVAAAKLAQQFRPLEVWWQGAWLIEKEGPDKGNGHIFLVPLVSGDLDFARLQFVLSSDLRDRVSYRIMFHHAYPKYGWGGGVGECSYLEDTTDFVRESGIKCAPESVASIAARWAGLEPRYHQEINEYQATQYWYPAETRRVDSPKWSDEDQGRCKREQEQRERATLAAAEQRINQVDIT